ncbi:MAG: iron-sulfur cluster assembly protein, partial [Terriglobales bacterium]
IDVIKSCYDPEIPINVYDLGLIYAIRIGPEGMVEVDMTLTAPGCPAAGVLPGEVESKVRSVPGVSDVKLDLVWEPPWDQNKMSAAARLQLGIDW